MSGGRSRGQVYVVPITTVNIYTPRAEFPWSISPEQLEQCRCAEKVGVANVSPRAFRRRIVRYVTCDGL